MFRLKFSPGVIMCLAVLFSANNVMSSHSPISDDSRRGIMAGIGIGVTPFAHLSVSGASTTESGIGFNAIIGYGFTGRDVLAFECNLTNYSPHEYFSKYSSGNPNVIQGIAALSWYRYFGNVDEAFFMMGGIGLYRAKEPLSGININICIGPECPEPETLPGIPEAWGLGMILGGGKELSHHFQAGLYTSFGFPKGYSAATGGPKVTNFAGHINLLLMWVIF